MYIFWKKRGLAGGHCSVCGRAATERCAWVPVIVESRRVDGRPRQVHIARLASIRSCCIGADAVRVGWWERVHAALDRLDVGEDDWFALMARLTAKVPPEEDEDDGWDWQSPARSSDPAAAAAVLGLAWPSPLAEVKARFRQLAKQHHPDLGGRPEEFLMVREAYERLSALAG